MAAALERLRASRAALEVDASSVAVSSAYYAMLYAARAALSERDSYARTHRGTWQLFRQQFVESGAVDAQLAVAAVRQQRPREDADYRAAAFSPGQALEAVELADRFVGAVREALG